VFEQAYGTDAITHQAIEEVLPEVYAKAVREHDLAPVERPKMEVLEESDGRPTKLKATVEVRPDIELGEYKGIDVPAMANAVNDADVDRSLEALAKDRATVVPVDRPAQLGDAVVMDYEGKIDGVAFEGGTATGQETELSEGRFIPGFVAGIVGMKAGETKDVEAHFPEQYGQPELAGKTAVFTITLHDVKQYDLPAIDDAFAASISENLTAEDLRRDVRRRLEAMAAGRERREIGNVVMSKLLSSHDFPLPAVMVDGEIDALMNEAAGHAARDGSSLEDYLAAQGKTEEEMRAEFRADAEQRVKGTLIIEQIAKREGIVATPADLSQELEALARQYGQPVNKIRKALGNGVLSLMDSIVRNKTLDFLIDNAKVDGVPRTAPEETPGTPA
jgi:trigger factor